MRAQQHRRIVVSLLAQTTIIPAVIFKFRACARVCVHVFSPPHWGQLDLAACLVIQISNSALTKQETDRDKTAGFKLRSTCDHFSES
jgi:hypothetical protein